MKVVINGGTFWSLNHFRGDLIRNLKECGHEVHALAGGTWSTMHSGEPIPGVCYHELPLARAGINPVRDYAYYQALKKLLGELKPDAILSYTHKPVVYGTLAACAAGVPHRFALVTGLGYAFIEGGGLKRKLAETVLSGLYRRATPQLEHVFFQNPDDRQLFLNKHLLRDNVSSSVVSGSGVDTSQFIYTPAREEVCARAERGGLRFLMIARLLKDKGVAEYAEAARILKQRYPASTFSLVGPHDPNPAAIAAADLDAWKQAGLIDYHPETSDPLSFYKDCDVYVLPSYREGMPRTVLEAMSVGRPIITTDVPGCRQTISNPHASSNTSRMGDNGWLVEVRRADALVEACEYYFQNPESLLLHGKESRKLAETVFDVQAVNSELMKVMQL